MIIQPYYYYLPIVVQETQLKGNGILFQARLCSQLYISIALSESFLGYFTGTLLPKTRSETWGYEKLLILNHTSIRVYVSGFESGIFACKTHIPSSEL